MGGVTRPNTSLLPRSAAALGLFEGLISRTLVKRFTASCPQLVACNQKQFSNQLPCETLTLYDMLPALP